MIEIFSSSEDDGQSSADTQDSNSINDGHEATQEVANFWPYYLDKSNVTPKYVSEFEAKVDAYEKNQPPDTEKQTYAGEWARNQMEESLRRNKSRINIGYNDHIVDRIQPCGIEFQSLFMHMKLFGSSGYGKSTILRNMMVQLAYGGHGFFFVDPKKDDAEELLQSLPDNRLDDVIWIEPGYDYEKQTVGMNLLESVFEDAEKIDDDISAREKEANQTAELVGEILEDDLGWGAIMETVVKTYVPQFMKAEENYTLLDLQQILRDQSEREKFKQYYGDEISTDALEQLEKADEDELRPIKRRLNKWAQNKTVRDMIAHEKSGFNLAKAIENDKIIILKTHQVSENVAKMITTIFINKIWNYIESRGDVTENPNPYFMIIDEYSKVETSALALDDILREARSYKLGFIISTQQPSQLNNYDDLRSCKNHFTFNPGAGAEKDAKSLAQSFSNWSADQLSALDKYKLVGRLSYNNKTTPAIEFDIFAPYPPLRSKEAMRKLKRKSVIKHGLPSLKYDENVDWSRYTVTSRLKGNNVQDSEMHGHKITKDEKLNEHELLEIILTAGIRHDTRTLNNTEDWIGSDAIVTETNRYLGVELKNMTTLAQALEQLPDAYVDKEMQGEQAYYRMKTNGYREIFTQDTGKQTGGKDFHRIMLKKTYELFTKLGYDVELVKQEGDKQSDAIAEPPIEIDDIDDIKLSKLEEIKQQFRNEYPRMWDLFKDETLSIETEKASIKSPHQVITNLSKSITLDNHCVFLVPDGAETQNNFTHWAQKVQNIIDGDAPFVRKLVSDGRVFYVDSGRNHFNLKDKSKPIYNKNDYSGSTSVRWKETEQGELICKINGEEYAQIDDISEFTTSNPSRTNFQYNCKKVDGMYEVRTGQNTIEAKFETKTALTDAGWKYISPPVIPKQKFSTFPETDEWTIMILPDADSEYNTPQIYNHDEKLEPVLPQEEDAIQITLDSVEQPTNDPHGENNDETTNENNDQQNELTIEKNTNTSNSKSNSESDNTSESDPSPTKPEKPSFNKR